MIALLARAFDNLFGRGEAAVTVPPLDGALRPNRMLDACANRVALPDVDCLAIHAGTLVASAGDSVHAITATGQWTPRKTYAAPVACIAPIGSDGLAVALATGEILVEGGEWDGRGYTIDGVGCITAMTFADGALYVANGSATTAPGDWQRDLLERNASGSVWRIDLGDGGGRRMADGLAWPAGVAVDGAGVVVSEAWKHRLVRLEPEGGAPPRVLNADMPGYPGRLSACADGWWLAVFAPRSQLIEFVLREPDYRRRMVAEVPAPYWIAPRLRSGRSYYEPLQGGGVKHLGLLKPWAPTMSFGMCARLDGAFQPRSSLQSRADGSTHGVTSVIEHDGETIVGARGDGVVLRLSPEDAGYAGGEA